MSFLTRIALFMWTEVLIGEFRTNSGIDEVSNASWSLDNGVQWEKHLHQSTATTLQTVPPWDFGWPSNSQPLLHWATLLLLLLLLFWWSSRRQSDERIRLRADVRSLWEWRMCDYKRSVDIIWRIWSVLMEDESVGYICHSLIYFIRFLRFTLFVESPGYWLKVFRWGDPFSVARSSSAPSGGAPSSQTIWNEVQRR